MTLRPTSAAAIRYATNILLVVIWLTGFQVFSKSIPAGPAPLREPDDPVTITEGLNYEYYEGEWTALPDFSGLAAQKFGSVVNVDLGPRGREIDYAFRFTGFIEVPADGVYTFYTTSDDGSRLQIGSTTVVENDGVHDATEASGTIGLKKGKHAFTIIFFEHLSASVLYASYAGPGIAKQLIPASALFRNGDPVAAWRLEAERASLFGPIAASNSGGYTGSGYAEFQNASSDYITFLATTPKHGIYQLTFRYGLAGDDVIGMNVDINTSKDTVISFPPTSSWNKWSTVTFATFLNEGSNTIRLIAIGSGGPHVDHLILGFKGVTSVVVGTDDDPVAGEQSATAGLVPYPNPSSGKFYINWPAQHGGPVEIELVNFNGAVMKSQQVGELHQGMNTLTVDAEGVTNGVYRVMVKHGNVKKAASVVITK